MAAKQTEGTITALYERLSRDDDLTGDSSSIINQKKYLESYAAQQGFENIVHYTDGGYSGGNFERPAWKRLIADIEAGKVAHVLVKNSETAVAYCCNYTHWMEWAVRIWDLVFSRKTASSLMGKSSM